MTPGMQAITTKYLGPTNHRGSRIKASAAAGSITIAWDHALDVSANHVRAARALAEKLEWRGTWRAGSTELLDGAAYVFVCDSSRDAFEVA